MRGSLHLALLPGLILVLVLVGCRTDVTVELYSSDLDRVAKKPSETVTTPALMAIQIPSADKCNEYTPQIVEIMKGVVKDFEPKGCKSAQMDSFLLGEVSALVAAKQEAWDSDDSLFGIMINPKGVVWLFMDREKYTTLNKRMENKFHQGLNLGKSKVSVVVNNDGRKTEKYAVAHVMVDGRPITTTQEVEVKRRRKVTIELSNVASKYLAEHGIVPVMRLAKSN